MNTDKLLLKYKNKLLLQYSVDLLETLPADERIIVTTNARLKSIVLPLNIEVAINPLPQAGQSESIRVGINFAKTEHTHFIFLAADQPLLTKADIVPLLEAANANREKIVFPVINSKPSSPTIFPVRFKSELLCLQGDSGGREIRDSNCESCFEVITQNPMNFKDFDTVEDIAGEESHDII